MLKAIMSGGFFFISLITSFGYLKRSISTFSPNCFFKYDPTKPIFIGIVSDTKMIVSYVKSHKKTLAFFI